MEPRPDHPAVRLKWSACTDCGKVRKNNEDSFLALQFDARELRRLGKYGEAAIENNDFAFAVSDGMGGAAAGEYASRIAVDKIASLLPRSFHQAAAGLSEGFGDVLTELFSQIHREMVMLGRSYEECAGMETTLSLCWFTPGWMHFGHIGDSRIYLLSPEDASIRQLTADDTHVGWLFRNGKINEREARTHPARNVLQKALGGGNQFIDPQLGRVAYESGDIFLLCTDGLMDGIYNERLTELVRESRSKGADAARLLVEESLRGSGRDNTTAVLVEAV